MLTHPNGVALCECGQAWLEISGHALVDSQLQVLAFRGQIGCDCGQRHDIPEPERHLRLVGVDKDS